MLISQAVASIKDLQLMGDLQDIAVEMLKLYSNLAMLLQFHLR